MHHVCSLTQLMIISGVMCGVISAPQKAKTRHVTHVKKPQTEYDDEFMMK